MKQRFSSPAEIYKFWEKYNFFKSDPSSQKKSYSILVPPPNLTGELHLGHAMQHSILDAVARFKRLRGHDVLLLPGVDHAGILFEATLNRELAKENLSKEKLGREKWLERAWKFKGEVYRSVSSTWRFMGLSADWNREVFTLDPGPQKAVFEQFKRYFEERLIYRGPYIVQWCPRDNTAIEDVEMEYVEKEEKLYIVRYLIYGTDESIEVATTRPETIFADTGMAVYPNHPKYEKLIGRSAINPLTKSKLPIFEDSRVDRDFGTGALKITPGHDLLDYVIGKDHNLEILQVVDKNGRMTDLAGRLAGLTVSEAREGSLELLKKNQALLDTKPYKHSVAVCERCKTVVEPLISEEWFVKMDGLAKGAIKVIQEGKINFLPKNYSKILVDWLENIHDWCISRSLWWGHRIPVWYPSKNQKSKSEVSKRKYKNQKSLSGSDEKNIRISLESPGPGWVQDEQVLDTWFSSGLWPLSTLGWPFVASAPQGKPDYAVIASTSMSLRSRAKRRRSNLSVNFAKQSKKKIATSSQDSTRNDKEGNNLLAKYFPWDFEISAPEIKYLWIARMIMISVHLTGKIPFKTMFFHGMLRDLEGRKFSKSLGNGIEPEYLIKNWGVDATRMALYTYAIPGRDGRVSKQILDERGKNFRNFGTKLRNIARFIFELKPNQEAHPRGVQSSIRAHPGGELNHTDDLGIKKELDRVIAKVTRHLAQIELHLATEQLYEFVWHKFADVYMEKSKKRRVEAQPTLEYVLKNVLILLHPFMPFVTEEIYQRFGSKKKSIMLEKWPSSRLTVTKPLSVSVVR